jgi:hypothetical protein
MRAYFFRPPRRRVTSGTSVTGSNRKQDVVRVPDLPDPSEEVSLQSGTSVTKLRGTQWTNEFPQILNKRQ